MANLDQQIEEVLDLIKDIPFIKHDLDYVDKEWDEAIPFEGGMSVNEALIHIKNVLIREQRKQKASSTQLVIHYDSKS